MNEFAATRLLVWGGSGHAKMLRPIIARAGLRVAALVERNVALPPVFPDAELFSDERSISPWLERYGAGSRYVLAIGGHNGVERCRLAHLLEGHGLKPFTVVHWTSFVAASAELGEGCQILPMAAVCEEAIIGAQSIVNTNASIDHECRFGRGVHIMPGATVAGCVQAGDYVTIGSNATIFPRLSIGVGAQVGAGAVVTRNVEAGTTVLGVPARLCKRSG